MGKGDVPERVDVLICGGGPVGLLIAYCLARYGVTTYVVEKHERAKQTAYGRAAMIAPRTLEMLDQLDLTDALTQIGFVVRGQTSYKQGEKVDRITAASSDISDTFFDHLLLCRQRYTEDVIRDGYSRYSDTDVHFGAELVDFSARENTDGFGVEATMESLGESHKVRSKYIIGADGGRSKVRELSGIQFEGERSNRHWIRIDGIVETNMPEARQGICGIESKSHGSILWACLDHGVTRVGFALPEELWDRLGADITREDVIGEAKKALEPFTLEFKTVDWWTVYSVGQRLAADYRLNDRVFLAGDAAHTHSSGAAQGMNTGLHDAVNLSWKLAGCLNGWLAEDVLDTYGTERRPIAKQIIDQDKIISVATGGEIPEAYKSDPEADAHTILTEMYRKNASLNTGLGIRYPPDERTVVASTAGHPLKVHPGERAPDVLMQRPGMRLPVRLQSLTKNHGKFTAILFCGDPNQTRTSIKEWRNCIDGTNGSSSIPASCSHMTIMMGENEFGSPSERLGVQCFGNAFYDTDGQAHARYGVAADQGAVVILRPDGTIGTICALGDGKAASKYFSRCFIAREETSTQVHEMGEALPAQTTGEVDIDKETGAGDESRVVYETV